jgi:hypothetical protein
MFQSGVIVLTRYSKKRTEELLEKYGKPIGYRNNIPIFSAIKDNEYQMKMFCSFCKHWHLHGYTKEIGHRSTHCGSQRIGRKFQNQSDSPFYKSGYYIVLVDGEEK